MIDLSENMLACSHNPYLRVNWLNLAQQCYDGGDFYGGVWGCDKALKITERSPGDTDIAWGVYPYDLGGTAAFYAEAYDKSLEWNTKAWKMDKKDKRLIGNLKLIRRHQEQFRFILIWTVRDPELFRKRYEDWSLRACYSDKLEHHLIVDSEEHKKSLSEFEHVVISGHPQWSEITSDLGGRPGDVVVLVTDYVDPPDEWDTWAYNQLENHPGCLRVNGEQIPIMDYACLAFTGGQVAPADAYLRTLESCGLLRDVRQSDNPTFGTIE